MMMRMEHDQMRGLLDTLDAALRTKDAGRCLDLSDTLMVLVQQHNMKEEQVLYPMRDPGAGRWARRDRQTTAVGPGHAGIVWDQGSRCPGVGTAGAVPIGDAGDRELGVGDELVLLHRREPFPLYDVLNSLGFLHHVDRLGDDYRIRIRHRLEAPR